MRAYIVEYRVVKTKQIEEDFVMATDKVNAVRELLKQTGYDAREIAIVAIYTVKN